VDDMTKIEIPLRDRVWISRRTIEAERGADGDLPARPLLDLLVSGVEHVGGGRTCPVLRDRKPFVLNAQGRRAARLDLRVVIRQLPPEAVLESRVRCQIPPLQRLHREEAVAIE